MRTISILFSSMIAAIMLLSFKPLPSHFTYSGASVNMLNKPKVVWVSDNHDFGEIPQGVPVSTEFTFTNTGNEALIITNVVTSCGCTASDYAKDPILPGKSSKIKVTYNAANKGTFTKSITVNSNDNEPVKVLSIKGVVK